MSNDINDPASLRSRIGELEAELAALRARLPAAAAAAPPPPPPPPPPPLSAAASAARFSRQLLVPGFGASAQRALASLRVLVVGCGGLGCPAATYLAAAGVGALTLVDDDAVSESNLQRQVAHSEAGCAARAGKAASLAAAVRALNSCVRVAAAAVRFNVANAAALVGAHDVVVDASDNAATRYLISDVAVLCARPVVSGAALGTEGQLAVYNFCEDDCAEAAEAAEGGSAAEGGAAAATAERGPCYRCLFPVAPPLGALGSCAENGVLGPVVGAIGCLQALEVMKVAAAVARARARRDAARAAAAAAAPGCLAAAVDSFASGVAAASPLCRLLSAAAAATPPHSPSLGAPLSGRLLLLDGADARVRVVRLRARRADCEACGARPSVRSAADSEAWCRAAFLPAADDPASMAASERAAVAAAAVERERDLAGGVPPAPEAPVRLVPPSVLQSANSDDSGGGGGGGDGGNGGNGGGALTVLLDVRPPHLFAVAAPRGAVNVPLPLLRRLLGELAADAAAEPAGMALPEVVCVCRRGADSAEAARLLEAAGVARAASVAGGLEAFKRNVDADFPLY
jgi:adenylyltransferase/sulfurtransferase